jgi:ketosteroid isomerase-like protein
MQSPNDAIIELDAAVNSKNMGTVLGFYEDDALRVMQPGRAAGRQGGNPAGWQRVRPRFAIYLFGMDINAEQIATHVMESGDIALFTSS